MSQSPIPIDHGRGLEQFGTFWPGQQPIILLSPALVDVISGLCELRSASVSFECGSVFLNQLLPLIRNHVPTVTDVQPWFMYQIINGFRFVHMPERTLGQSFMVIL